jgi:signal transduction histidine kinase
MRIGRVGEQPGRRWLADAAICLPLLAIGLGGTGPAGHNQPASTRAPDHFAYLLVLVAVAGVALRRRPAWSLAVTGAALTAYFAAGYPYGPIIFTAPIALGNAAARWPLRRVLVVGPAYLLVLLGAVLVKESRTDPPIDAVGAAWLAFAWLAIGAGALAVGAAVRVRGESAARVRAEQAQRAASDERLRMAQDLHDTLGHGLAVIAMQAGVALHVMERDPRQARESMEAVRATSRESLEHLRAQLDALRGTDDPGARRPAAGIAELPRLVERVRAGGLTVRLKGVTGLPPVPEMVGAATYRIVQESLTNVLRHAGTNSAEIVMAVSEGALRITVTDEGPALGAPSPGGSGIAGMRAQAESLGGTLTAGPGPGAGFTVAATLPVAAS